MKTPIPTIHVPSRSVKYFSTTIDMKKPRNMLPESPMNIFAGLKLCIKNPKEAPTITRGINGLLSVKLRNAEENSTVLIAKPSKPSMRFMAFVIPIIHR